MIQVLKERVSPGNAHLCSLNTLLSLRAPFHLAQQPSATVCACTGGVSAFGFSGTIAHAVLQHAVGEPTICAAPPILEYRRRAFPWCRSASARNCTYAVCWAAVSEMHAVTSCKYLLVSDAKPAVCTTYPIGLPNDDRRELLLLLSDDLFTPALPAALGAMSVVQHLGAVLRAAG
eukprot:6558432-Prymnesium_polylepis.1